MRILIAWLTLFFTISIAISQEEQQVAWFIDDFDGDALRSSWKVIAGDWTVGAENLTSGGANSIIAVANDCYLMRTKPYVVEARLKGGNGGVMFCMEDQGMAASCHIVGFRGTEIYTGYMSIDGKLTVTRVVEYIVPSTYVRLRIVVDPLKKSYEVLIQDRSVALENLRYRSGFTGLCSNKAGIQFDYLQVLGEGQRDMPAAFLKSNETQIDHVSYMTLMDENMILVNPVLGIVQRVNSLGGYILEIPIQGPRSIARGVCVGPNRSLYVVDGGENTVRIYNRESQLEQLLSGSFKDPRAVAVDANGLIYVLDTEGIKLVNKKGEVEATGCAGQFKDPQSLYLHANYLYVADAGAGKVHIINRATLSIDQTIIEQLVHPTDASIDPKNGDIYIADPGANVVFQFGRDGTFIDKLDPVTVTGFISPRTVRIRESNIIVGDFERVLVFKKEALSVRPSLIIG